MHPRRAQPRESGLDAIDAALIRALQEDGRASINDLAAGLGISRDAASLRLRRLTEHEGVRVVAALDPQVVGHHVLTHAAVAVDGPLRPVADRIAAIPNSVFVSLTSGSMPLVFESRHRDSAELHEVLDAVRAIPGVRSLLVTTYVDVLSGFFVADRRSPATIDALDTELIRLLQRDGRMSFRALGDAVHLSPSSVRARVHRLVTAGVIRISAITSGQLTRSRIAIGLGITARGDAAPIREFLLRSPDVDFAARTHGRFDYVATLEGPSAAHLLRATEELRALTSVSAVESWAHYDIVKENYERAIERAVGGAGGWRGAEA
ncbi:Lrp/AsnC family transcriptional regulator [Leucobacter chromiireducens]|uniref:Lrp/AsnC family transcriptional regulator n=1 Tax=Leucobacter chromiireducens TaxID=283877 RepID=UPI000F641D2D|nr:Lrp/AsnC family transcriptional regulator [Leucobacter chromiireducens]